jgi:hypothetical protein
MENQFPLLAIDSSTLKLRHTNQEVAWISNRTTQKSPASSTLAGLSTILS